MKKIIIIGIALLLFSGISVEADEIDDLNAEIDRLTGQLENMTGNFTDLQLDYFLLEIHYNNLNTSHTELMMDFANLTADHNTLLVNMTTQYNALLLNYSGLLEQHVELQTAHSTIEADHNIVVTDLQTNINDLNAQIEALGGDVIGSEAEYNDLKNYTDTLFADKNNLTFQITDLNQQLNDNWRFSPTYLFIGLIAGIGGVIGFVKHQGGDLGIKSKSTELSDDEMEDQYALEKKAQSVFQKGGFTEKDVVVPKKVEIDIKKPKVTEDTDPIKDVLSSQGQKQIQDDVDASNEKKDIDYSKTKVKKDGK